MTVQEAPTTPCPTCSAPVSQSWTGRPRVYCDSECRHEMARRRDDLAALEADLVVVRQAVAGFGRPRKGHAMTSWESNFRYRLSVLPGRIDDLRARVVPVIRPEDTDR